MLHLPELTREQLRSLKLPRGMEQRLMDKVEDTRKFQFRVNMGGSSGVRALLQLLKHLKAAAYRLKASAGWLSSGREDQGVPSRGMAAEDPRLRGFAAA